MSASARSRPIASNAAASSPRLRASRTCSFSLRSRATVSRSLQEGPRVRRHRVHEDGNALHARYRALEGLQPLGAQRAAQRGHPGEVAARMGEAADDPAADRVAGGHHHDGHGAGRPLGGQGSGIGAGQDDVDALLHQGGRELEAGGRACRRQTGPRREGRPSTQPSSCSACRNALRNGASTSADCGESRPIRVSLPGACALTAPGVTARAQVPRRNERRSTRRQPEPGARRRMPRTCAATRSR